MLHCSNHFVEIGELGSLVFVNLGAFGASDSTASELVAASPRRNVLAVGQRGATFLSHVTSIAAEVAHGLSDRTA